MTENCDESSNGLARTRPRVRGLPMLNRFVPPPAVVALVAAGMWALDRIVSSARVAFALQTPLAVGLAIAAVGLLLSAVVALMRARTTINPLRPERASALVTTGIFAFSRNPIYLADLLLLGAFALHLGNPMNIVLLGGFVAWINHFQIAPEEHALAQRFGNAYAAYRAAVRRWL